MIKVLMLNTSRDYYDVRDIVETNDSSTMSVGEIIDLLKNLPREAKVVFRNDNGFTFGAVRGYSFRVKNVETYAEELEREQREEREGEDKD